MSEFYRRASAAPFLLLLAAVASAAEAPKPPAAVPHKSPVLSSVFPQGANPGQQIEVTILGQYLDRARELVFTKPGIRATVLSSSFTRMRARFDVEAHAAYGPHLFRMISPRGPSNVLLFRLGDQPHLVESEPNGTLETAEAVKTPVTINACLDRSGDFDFFRFEAKANETWVFDLRSGRNGSGLDPSLILLDSQGRKLEHEEDTFIWDPFFTHRFSQPGSYYAVVQPTRDRTQPTHCYQLDIRQAPHLETISPLSFAPGEQAEAALFGAALLDDQSTLVFGQPGFDGQVLEMRGDRARVRIAVPASAPPGPVAMTLVSAKGRSNELTFLVDATPRYRGQGDLKFPTSVRGTARYRQPESFPFHAAKGDRLVFEVRAQRFGSPVDSVLRILDSTGKEIAKNDDGKFPEAAFNKDSLLVHEFEQDGTYTLQMRNLVKTTGEDYPYELIARRAGPAPLLLLESDRVAVVAGQGGSVEVKADRRDGYEGPIRVEVRGLPSGVAAKPAEIAAGQDSVQLEFVATEDAPARWAPVEVVTPLAPAPAGQTVRIASGGGEGAAWAPIEGLAVALAEPSLFGLEAQLTSVNLVKGGSASVPVTITRAAGFTSALEFGVENLPPGVELEKTTAPESSDSVTLRLKAAPNAPSGRAGNVAILATAPDGRTEEAPQISIVVD